MFLFLLSCFLWTNLLSILLINFKGNEKNIANTQIEYILKHENNVALSINVKWTDFEGKSV